MSSLHQLVEPWWVECDEHPVRRGQLVHAFVPRVGLTPYVLDAEGRKEPTQHQTALFLVRPLRIKDRGSRPQLSVAHSIRPARRRHMTRAAETLWAAPIPAEELQPSGGRA